MLWISGLLVLVFGGLTLYLQDEFFIKIKPTVIFTLFGIILLIGYFFKKPFIKFLFGETFGSCQVQIVAIKYMCI